MSPNSSSAKPRPPKRLFARTGGPLLQSFGGNPPFARPLERGKALSQRFDHGDLLAEGPARDVAPPLCLTGKDVGDVWIHFRLSVLHGFACTSQGSEIPARSQYARHAPREAMAIDHIAEGIEIHRLFL